MIFRNISCDYQDTGVEDDGDKLSCLGSQVEVDTNNRVDNVDVADNGSEKWSSTETMNTGIPKCMLTYYFYM